MQVWADIVNFSIPIFAFFATKKKGAARKGRPFLFLCSNDSVVETLNSDNQTKLLNRVFESTRDCIFLASADFAGQAGQAGAEKKYSGRHWNRL